MSPTYIRNRPDRKENAAAAVASAVLATGVGLVTFYLVRLFLARDTVVEVSAAERGDAGSPGE